MSKKIKITILCCVFGFISPFVSTTNLQAEVLEKKQLEVTNNSDVTTYADYIVYRYRVQNGIKQKRRWNATKQIWVDSQWINV